MKLYITYVSLGLAVLALLATAGNMWQGDREPNPGTSSNQQAYAAVRNSTSGDNNMAPSFEEIVATLQSLVGDERPISDERWEAQRQYAESLIDKRVEWQGWVGAVSPDKPFFQNDEELAAYDGDFRVYVMMQEPNITARIDREGQVILRGTTRMQVEQLRSWQDPVRAGSSQKTRFSGSIEGITEDPTILWIRVSEMVIED